MIKIMDSITLPQIVFGPSEYLFKLYTVWIDVWDAEEEEIHIQKLFLLFLFHSVIVIIFTFFYVNLAVSVILYSLFTSNFNI